MATIGDQLGKHIITAMKAKESDKLTTLRMVKSALKSKEIDKREPLTDNEEQSILTTLLKQRRESVESFTKGNRPGPRDMGTIMKVVQQRLLADGIRADGKVVSEMVKAELAK